VTVSPRRQARATVAECQRGGGEYTEPLPAAAQQRSGERPEPAPPKPQDDPLIELKSWLPMAAAGLPDAQVVAGELFERAGKPALAQHWYSQAAAQGHARAMVDLADLLERGRGVPRDSERARQWIWQAAGLQALSPTPHRGPALWLVDPAAALRLPPSAAHNAVWVDGTSDEVLVTGRAESPAGIASVTVNGKNRPHDAEGLFTVPLLLGTQPTLLQITAHDQDGATASAEYVLQRRAPDGVRAAAPADRVAHVPLPGRRWALVIANQRYERWEVLDTPAADGQALASSLHDRFGFEVTLLMDATRQGILGALARLRQQAAPDDQVIVYYAGHGQMDPVTARGYWIPVDADLRDLSGWVSVIDVTDQLSAMQARHVLVIADSCYSGTLAGSLVARIDAALSAEQRQRHLSQLAQGRARVAFTSGGMEPVVDGGGGTHSLFARSLLDVLGQVQAPIAAQELSSAVASRFVALGQGLQVAQRPVYAPIAFAGHEAGDFVLAPRP
jgi:uncharacterized caspase-like protein